MSTDIFGVEANSALATYGKYVYNLHVEAAAVVHSFHSFLDSKTTLKSLRDPDLEKFLLLRAVTSALKS